MSDVTYDPGIFDVATIEDARKIILTEEPGLTTDDRWAKETPYLVELLSTIVEISPHSTVLDYGCGIGRLTQALSERFGCRGVGVDISAAMRAYAMHLQPTPRFFACSPEMLDAIAPAFDLALAIWVLQHCYDPRIEIAAIKNLLKPGGVFFVVNEIVRNVPTREHGWVHDGLDVRVLLSENFRVVQEGRLDPGVVSNEVSQRTFWGIYQRSE